MNFILPATFSFLLTFLLIRCALYFFPKWGMMDRPHLYGYTRKPIPYYGGLTIFLAFVISILAFVTLNMQLAGLLMGGFLIALIGFLDDRFNLSPLLRLFAQAFAGAILFYFGVGIFAINLPFVGLLEFSTVFAFFVTVFWVMTLVNTVNFVDGVPGLSSGLAFIGGLTIFLLSTNASLHENPASQIPIAQIAIIFSMSGLAFLIHDFPRPKLLMGDTGSTFIGFVIATLAIFSGGKIATAFLVLGVPILDMVWVVLRRIYNGQKFWKGDKKHLHHRLLDIGLSKKQVVILYLFITAVLGFSAAFLVNSRQKLFMLIALLFFMLLLALSLVLIQKKKANN